MRIFLIIAALPFGLLAFIAAFGVLVSLLNGSSKLMWESFTALIVSSAALFLITKLDKKSDSEDISAGHKNSAASEERLPKKDEMEIPREPRVLGVVHEKMDLDSGLTINVPEYVRVAGVSHANREGPTRQECICKISEGDRIWLERDSSNPYDTNAIRVMTTHGQIGYIPREHAASLACVETKNIRASFASKGRATNGLWGCTIKLSAQEKPKTSSLHAKNENKNNYSTALLKDGRAYPHLLLLQELDSHAAEVFSLEDGIKIIHSSLGEGEIIEIQGRSDARALLTVKYASETCKHTSDIFSSPYIANIPMSFSMKDTALWKYLALLPSAKPYEKIKLSDLTISTDFDDDPFSGLSTIEIEYIMGNEPSTDFADYEDQDNGYDGVDSYWHEYHKHD